MGIKIKSIMMDNNCFFIIYHVDSKYHNDFTNQIISINTLFDELLGYKQNGIIYLGNILEVYDINNNIIDMDLIYQLLNGVVVANALISDNINFVVY